MEKQSNYCGLKVECDKFLSNTNKEREIDIGQNMRELNRDITCGKETTKLVLQFPDGEQDTVLIQKEIKAILIAELYEQMKNIRKESKREVSSSLNGRSGCK